MPSPRKQELNIDLGEVADDKEEPLQSILNEVPPVDKILLRRVKEASSPNKETITSPLDINRF